MGNKPGGKGGGGFTPPNEDVIPSGYDDVPAEVSLLHAYVTSMLDIAF